MEKDKQYTEEEWIKNFENLMVKYNCQDGKSTEKIQEIAKLKKEKGLKELFEDIRNIFSITIELIPEGMYSFIFEVIKELSNNKNKTNSDYLEKIVEFLFNIPNFYENFCKILTCRVSENDYLLVCNKINDIQRLLIEKWNNNFKSFKDKYFKKNKQKTKLQEITELENGKKKKKNLTNY